MKPTKTMLDDHRPSLFSVIFIALYISGIIGALIVGGKANHDQLHFQYWALASAVYILIFYAGFLRREIPTVIAPNLGLTAFLETFRGKEAVLLGVMHTIFVTIVFVGYWLI